MKSARAKRHTKKVKDNRTKPLRWDGDRVAEKKEVGRIYRCLISGKGYKIVARNPHQKTQAKQFQTVIEFYMKQNQGVMKRYIRAELAALRSVLICSR